MERQGQQPGALSPAWLLTWLGELTRVAPGLLAAHVPGAGGLDARTREQLMVTVADANGSRFSAWVHGAWQEFLGPVRVDDRFQPLVDFARASAEAGWPLDSTVLDARYEPSVVRSARAIVARAEIGSVLANAAGDLVGTVLKRPDRGRLGFASQVVVVGLAVPVLVPVAAVAGALKALVRLAPPVPIPELPPEGEANLLVHLLADALPSYLGHAVVRTVLLWNPLVLAVGVRAEGVGATLRIGHGKVSIVNGVRADALVVVDDGVEPLLHLAAGSIVRQLTSGPRETKPSH